MQQSILIVHGAWHDASFFAPVIKALERRGVGAIAMDLPGHGARRGETATLTNYASAIVKALESFDSPPLLVGHSMGGMAITAAAELAPDRIRALVYLCAFLPIDGETFMELSQRTPQIEGAEIDPAAGTITIPPIIGEQVFYHDCPDPAHWAGKLQPQSFGPAFEPVGLTPERFGRIPRTYVRCTNDRVITPALQTEMAVRAKPIRMVDMACGHSPFLARTEDLVDVLLDVADATTAPRSTSAFDGTHAS